MTIRYMDPKYENTLLFSVEDLVDNIRASTPLDVYRVKDNFLYGNIPYSSQESDAKSKYNELKYTDINHPVVITKSNNEPNYINTHFFEQNKSQIISAVQEVLLKRKLVKVYKEFYTDDLVDKLLETEARKITFFDIEISDDIKNKLHNSVKNVEIVKYIDGEYEYEYLNNRVNVFGNYSLDDLEFDREFYISTPINEDHLSNIKFFKDNVLLNIKMEYRPVDNLKIIKYQEGCLKIIEEIIRLNKNIKLNIIVFDKLHFDTHILPKIIDSHLRDKIEIEYNYEKYSIEDYSNVVFKLDELVKDIKASNMSPFEKYLKVYDIAKNYKSYNESKNHSDSRSLKFIFDNEYMVCVGFAKLLSELLTLVDIGNINYTTKVLSVEELENYNRNLGLHERNIVYLKDDKYGIDGYYCVDPTFDNNLDKDFYNYATTVFSDMQKEENYYSLEDIDYIFDNDTFDDYCLKVNKLINKKIRLNNAVEAMKDVIDLVMRTMLKLDIEFYNQIYDKYIVLTKKSSIEEYNQIFTLIGHNVINKTNKKISSDTLVTAISNIKDIDKDEYKFKIEYIEEVIRPYTPNDYKKK